MRQFLSRHARLIVITVGLLLIGGTTGTVVIGFRNLSKASANGPALHTSPSPSPTAAATASASAEAASSSPSPTATAVAPSDPSGVAPPALTSVNFSCQLPVASSDAPVDGNSSDGVRGHGGFLSLPSGVFTVDPKSLGSYDAVAGKWLPVPPTWVAPDGSTYAYTRGATLHVVSVSGGSDQQFTIPYSAQVVAFDSAGVYLEQVTPNSDAAPHGLGLLDPATGDYSQVIPGGWLGDEWFYAEHARFAYYVDLNTSWGQPPQTGPKPVGNELFRVDLSSHSGGISVIAIPDAALRVVGFDGGDQPVVSASSADHYRLYTAASIRPGGTPSSPGGLPEYEGPPDANWNPTGPAQGDAHGVWFGSAAGSIWLYSPSSRIHRIAALPLHSPMIAGTCR